MVGCVQPETSTVTAESTQDVPTMIPMKARIIVKFTGVSTDPSKSAFVKKLSQSAGASLVYLRPISTGAHVFSVEGLSTPEQLADVIKRLEQRSDVLYVEQDRILRHQLSQ